MQPYITGNSYNKPRVCLENRCYLNKACCCADCPNLTNCMNSFGLCPFWEDIYCESRLDENDFE